VGGDERRKKMVVTIVEVRVKPEHIDRFIAATQENHRGSVQERGNMRFDVLQSPQDASLFLLYEAYDSPESAAAHKNTPHYAKWRDAVAPWMAVPRRGTPYKVICP
jgi:(4S)-4-hydroxy-5-phosphonooxypentane-2,3-dione isomerase